MIDSIRFDMAPKNAKLRSTITTFVYYAIVFMRITSCTLRIAKYTEQESSSHQSLKGES
jgi:hypothetical protein